MQMADHLAADGFKDMGYQYVNIDVHSHLSLTSIVINVIYIHRIAGVQRREMQMGSYSLTHNDSPME